VANERALRTNFLGGLVENNPLIASDTAFTSAALAAAPVVDALSHSTVILDPDGVAGTPEIVWITVHTAGATTATIQRAQEGTSARNHDRDTPWIHAATAADYGTGVGRDRAWQKATAASTLDDEFNDSSLDPAWVRYDTAAVGATPVVWTEGADVLSVVHQGSASDNAGPAHCLLRPIGALTSPMTIEGAFRMMRRYATNYQMWGLIMTDGVAQSSKAVWVMPFGNTGIGASNQLSTRVFARLDGGEAAAYGNTNWELIGGAWYQRLRWSAANTFQTEYSCDGVSWYRFPTADISFTMTPTHVGVGLSTWTQNVPCMGSVEYFRVN